MTRLLVGAAALVVAPVTTAAAGLWTFVHTCGISDVANSVPAPASMQGRVCDASDHWLNVLPWAVLVGSVLLAVGLALSLWAVPRLRFVGLTAGLWLPLLAAGVLTLPSDSCSEAQRGELPAYACDQAGNG